MAAVMCVHVDAPSSAYCICSNRPKCWQEISKHVFTFWKIIFFNINLIAIELSQYICQLLVRAT